MFSKNQSLKVDVNARDEDWRIRLLGVMAREGLFPIDIAYAWE